MWLLGCGRCAGWPAKRVSLELGRVGWGNSGFLPLPPSKPDLERLRTVRVLEVPKLGEVEDVGPMRAQPDVCGCSRGASGPGLDFLPPYLPQPGAQVCKQTLDSPPSPTPTLPLLEAGLKARRPPPPPNLVGAAVVLCLLPPSPAPPHTPSAAGSKSPTPGMARA